MTVFKFLARLSAGFILTVLLAGSALPQTKGILEKKAPPWIVEQWINTGQDKKSINVSDFRGKVVYLYCFQSWCPGCHKYGFPTLQKLLALYQDSADVRFVAVQTTFEGFSVNNFENARRTAQEYNLKIPIGHSGSGGVRSQLMRDYRTGGTPWTIIIDQKGIVRYNDFHIKTEQATDLINKLLKDKPLQNTKFMMPLSRDGGDMIGKKLDLSKLQFANTKNSFEPEGKVSLVRWWTDTCPFCSASLPAIEQFRERFADDAFQTLAVYHPKPPRPIKSKDILKTAIKIGYTGTVAIDSNWDVLDQNYLSTANRSATSVTFILDKQGLVRFVHPGPEFQKTEDPLKQQENDDYNDIAAAIEFLLRENINE